MGPGASDTVLITYLLKKVRSSMKLLFKNIQISVSSDCSSGHGRLHTFSDLSIKQDRVAFKLLLINKGIMVF